MDAATAWVDAKAGDGHTYELDGPHTVVESEMIFSPKGTCAVSVDAGNGFLWVGNNGYDIKSEGFIKETDGWNCIGEGKATIVWIIRK
ncbi:hypothetical protein EG329_003754 [Mollisiaceae sp. DMI_Dod_QoI]|nr:hypothetical protein EG329_003754 [Helotiales sp. DMI_Dod_QoI]